MKLAANGYFPMENISIADSIEPKENDHIKKDDNAAANENAAMQTISLGN